MIEIDPRVLIVGGTGQLGRCVSSALSKCNIDFLAPTSDFLDITDVASVEEYFKYQTFSHVINCSAWTDVAGAESQLNSAFAVNETGPRLLSEACIKKRSILIHISTDFVFGDGFSSPISEDDKTQPVNTYGKSKLSGEIAIVNSGLRDYYIIRTSWLYSQYGKNFVRTMVQRALANQPSHVVIDQIGSPTNGNDLSQALINLIKLKPEFGVYNFSNRGEISWFDFAQEIYRLCGNRQNLVSKISTQNMFPARPKYSVLNLSKWKNITSLTPPLWSESLARDFETIANSVRNEK